MKKLFLTTVLILISIVSNAKELKLWYEAPATNWWEALPIGNSRLGAMDFGGTAHEEIQFNEETFWAGGPYSNNNPNGLSHLKEIQQMIFNGKNKEAEQLLNKVYLTNNHGMKFLPVGNLYIDMNDLGSTTNFYRDLNLNDAITTTRFTSNGVTYTRRVFASLTDGVIIIRITADRKNALNFNVSYNTILKENKISCKNKELILYCNGSEQEGIKSALRAESHTKVKCDGTIKTVDNHLNVSNATEATIYLSAATNFINYHKTDGNESEKAENIIRKAMKKSYEKLLNDHISYYKNEFDRVKLTLPESKMSDSTTIVRIKNFHKYNDQQLCALLFQFGRYLLISSSQPGGQPANLQGVWNKELNAPWDSKYTVNINTEMNYWPAEVTNLSENAEPLFSMIKDLSETGHQTAKVLYGANGWVCHHNTDLWRACGPVDAAFFGMWPNSGGWLIQHIWQHYLYNCDKDFLKTYYPIMKGAADFYLSFLTEDPNNHWMVTCPSMSPEHGPNGTGTSITAGCTMDNQIAFDALNSTLLASKAIGGDKNYEDSLSNMIARLTPMHIGQYNQLQEWLTDSDDPQDNHRHVSQLYGLYPSNQISPELHPELFQAAKNTLIQRGDMATGWSLSWKLNFWSRLRDGNHAYKIICNLLNLLPNDRDQWTNPEGRTYPNLFTAHPPFQIDCNFGYTAGVAEMLLQSHDDAVQLLPALPDAWNKGEISGLKARGGFTVDMKWEAGQLTATTIHSSVGGTLRIRSYVPLKGEGLKKAEGNCPNSFLASSDIKDPIVSKKITAQLPLLYNCYEYDVETIAGKDYHFERAER